MADEENPPPPPPPPSGNDPATPPVEPEPVLESPESGDDYVMEEAIPQDLEMNRNPSVGKGPTKALVSGFIMFVVMGVVLWSLFSGTAEEAKPEVKTVSVAPPGEFAAVPTPLPPAAAPVVSGTALPPTPTVPPVPPPPPPPTVPPAPPPPPKFTAATTSLAPPPPPPSPSSPPPPTPTVDTALAPITADAGGTVNQARQARLRSNMLILDSNPGAGGSDTDARNALNANDPNTAFQANVLKASKAKKERATYLGNLNITVAQGKIINAVLETAINTDLPGPLRAIVSRDIYTESGREIAVPKGSRLIGVYNSSILRGQSRVLIVWTRILRPDGIDIEVGSPGVDSLGRAGVNGLTDQKYAEIFSAALLTSAITVGVAAGAQAISGDQSTTTTNSNGTTTTGDAAALAAAGTVANVGQVGQSIVDTMLDLKPTITVDQGTLINVFVNKDLTFPIAASGTTFIN